MATLHILPLARYAFFSLPCFTRDFTLSLKLLGILPMNNFTVFTSVEA